MASGMNRSAVGFWQRLESRFAALTPRQAYVTRVEGKTVWARFAGEASTAPASRFPTTVAGVAAGTTGWVVTLGGGKGLFVATGIAAPKTADGGGYDPKVMSTSGAATVGSAATVTGLVPYSVVKVSVWSNLRYSGSAGAEGHVGMRITHNGGNTDYQSDFFTCNTLGSIASLVRTEAFPVPANGTISAQCIAIWRAGTWTAGTSNVLLMVTP